MNYFLLTIFLLGLVACNSSTGTKNLQVKPSIDTNHLSWQNVNLLETEPSKDFYFPNDTIFMAKILTTGTFHNDEVWNKADRENWSGLFKSGEGYYVAKTAIITKRFHDEIVDEKENEKTGWQVQTTNKDTSILLFAGLTFMKNRQVQGMSLPKTQIFPGDSVKFNYLGSNYLLFAKGNKDKDPSDPEGILVSNYKLYLTALRNGKTMTQLIVAQPKFDDQMITLLFAGDIDGDGFVDFIIDTSNHYNAIVPTLYLSKPANPAQLLKVVGQHVSVGC